MSLSESNARLLIVEDSKVVTKILQHLTAQSLDCKVDFAENFAEGELLLAKHDYFLALTDLNLPDAPNGEIVDLVQSHSVPCMVLTGNLDAEQRQRLLDKGIVDYILKENRFSFEYAVRLISRLQKNQQVKVLVADDSRVSRKLVRSLLELYLYQVVEAEDGFEALDMLEKYPDIKLLITDYNMPLLNGIGLVIRAREKISREKLAIIGISSDSDEGLSARFIKNGANDFLQKPFVQEEFHCRVVNTLDSLEMICKLWEQANLDYLTTVYNRRYFFNVFKQQLEQIRDKQGSLSMALLDLDFFKKINDTYGHDVGDEILIEFSKRLKQFFGQHFIVSRFGGEEFIVAFKGLSEQKTYALMDKFRAQIESTPFNTTKGNLNITVSTGLVELDDENLDELVQRADKALYKAKESGRNIVCIDS